MSEEQTLAEAICYAADMLKGGLIALAWGIVIGGFLISIGMPSIPDSLKRNG